MDVSSASRPRVLYDPDVLAEAASVSHSVAEVVRRIGAKDHVNGDWLDNRPANLRFLCPNCHSQTATFGRRTAPTVEP